MENSIPIHTNGLWQKKTKAKKNTTIFIIHQRFSLVNIFSETFPIVSIMLTMLMFSVIFIPKKTINPTTSTMTILSHKNHDRFLSFISHLFLKKFFDIQLLNFYQ